MKKASKGLGLAAPSCRHRMENSRSHQGCRNQKNAPQTPSCVLAVVLDKSHGQTVGSHEHAKLCACSWDSVQTQGSRPHLQDSWAGPASSRKQCGHCTSRLCREPIKDYKILYYDKYYPILHLTIKFTVT